MRHRLETLPIPIMPTHPSRPPNFMPSLLPVQGYSAGALCSRVQAGRPTTGWKLLVGSRSTGPAGRLQAASI